MIDCQKLTFSSKLSGQRVAQAEKVFGASVLKYILCFALYLLGVNRNVIAKILDISPGSLRTLVRRLLQSGLAGFEDRRCSSSAFLPPAAAIPPQVSLRKEERWVVVDFGIQDREMKISRDNALQIKTVLLTLLNNKLVSTKDVAAILGITAVHTGNLAQNFLDKDVTALVEKRQGQKQDYRVSPEVKAELIQQFVVNVLSRRRTSARQLAEDLSERCNLKISQRTVGHHVAKLGLPKIKESLPSLLAEVTSPQRDRQRKSR